MMTKYTCIPNFSRIHDKFTGTLQNVHIDSIHYQVLILFHCKKEML